jgi:hypothetical protein
MKSIVSISASNNEVIDEKNWTNLLFEEDRDYIDINQALIKMKSSYSDPQINLVDS